MGGGIGGGICGVASRLRFMFTTPNVCKVCSFMTILTRQQETMSSDKIITELQTTVEYISEALAKIESVISSLRSSTSSEKEDSGVEMVHSRIHRDVPPIIPADLASGVSRMSTSEARVQPQTNPHYVNWADNLSRLSTVSRSSRVDGTSDRR